MSHEMSPREKAYASSLPFTQSKIFRENNGDLLIEYLDDIEKTLRNGLTHSGQHMLTEYLYYLNSLRELETEYEFYSGWTACRKHLDDY